MKKNSLQLKQERDGLFEEHRTLAAKESLTDEEQTRFDALPGLIEEKDAEVTRAEGHERITTRSGVTIRTDGKPTEEKEVGQYSLARAIVIGGNMREGGKLDGLEYELHQDEASRKRDIKSGSLLIPERVLHRASAGQNVTTAADGGNLVQEAPLYYYDALRNALVLVQLGAKFLTGLVGNLPLVGGSNFTAAFVAEGVSVSAAKIAFSKATMTPKRVAGVGAISKQLVRQTSISAQNLVTEAISGGVAEALQNAAINGNGSGANPTGILNASGIGSVAIGDTGGAISWPKIVELESKVALENAAVAKMGYLTNSKVIGDLKTIEKSSGSARFLMENGQANGYSVLGTNTVPSNLTKSTGTSLSAMIFGSWNKLIIGAWGGLEIIVDPLTLADQGDYKLIVDQYSDVAIENVKHFAACKDISTNA